MDTRELDQLCINTIRTLSIDAVQKANSGHPGLPLGAAPMAYVLWHKHLKHDPAEPKWADRDRFVLSAGHGSMLLYSMLHLTGYALSMDDLKAFRQWGSKTPGHPEYGHTLGVEATTGPLGQGTANAVGMAIAERWLAARYNRPGHTIVDHHTYALAGDGDLMEGISAEAASLAGHLGLGKLVMLYDSNDVTLDGPASMSFGEDVAARYASYGWQVLRVDDGDRDLAALDRAIASAKAETAKPSLIIVRTTIGFGAPKQGTCKVHGAPLGADGVKETKKALGWDPEAQFLVPDAAGKQLRSALERGAAARKDWQARFDAWAKAHPELANEWKTAWANELPKGWENALPAFAKGSDPATREAGGKVLNAIAAKVPWLIGGDADLSESTKTAIEGSGNLSGRDGAGRNIRYGVREHAMGAIANGIAYHGGARTYTATFFVFSDYMRPAIRLAAMNHLPVVFVFTHDSVALGEDGPTHQPIEHLAALRAIPNLHVVRPCDGNETAEAWRHCLERTGGPSVLVLSRQKLPVVEPRQAGGALRGGYVIAEAAGGAPRALLIASGSEVGVALAAQRELAAEGIAARVVSLPCWESFAAQPQAYRDAVLPPSVRARVSIEAGATFGWQRWIGEHGIALGIDRFGASAPGNVNLEKLGITSARAAAAVRELLLKNATPALPVR
ncbi:MAG: transketolase [Planctomycetota bacterium]|nr:MAG: transketolase [Planctomycetota bacterium]